MTGHTRRLDQARRFAARALIVLSVTGVGFVGTVGAAQAAKPSGTTTGHKTH